MKIKKQVKQKRIMNHIKIALFTIMALYLTGCGLTVDASKNSNGSVDLEQQDDNRNSDSGTGSSNTAGSTMAEELGLISGFPTEIPFYDGAHVMDSNNFNDNNYTVLYSVSADLEDVFAFYQNEFDLDDYGNYEDGYYYEGIEYGDILISGLTIETSGDDVNVYMTVKDLSQESSDSFDDSYEDSYEDGYSSSVMTYDSVEAVSLPDDYDYNIVPIPDMAKVMDYSFVPDEMSGFIDLILPASEYEAAVAFYEDALQMTAVKSTNSIQEGATFYTKVEDCTVSLYVTHILSEGNDVWAQIVIAQD